MSDKKKAFDTTKVLNELLELGLAIGACLDKGMTKREVVAATVAFLEGSDKWNVRRSRS